MADRTSPAARNIYYQFTADRDSKLVRRPLHRRQQPQQLCLRCRAPPLPSLAFHGSAPFGGAPGARQLTVAGLLAQYIPNAMKATSVSPYNHRSFLRTTVTRLVRSPAALAAPESARATHIFRG